MELGFVLAINYCTNMGREWCRYQHELRTERSNILLQQRHIGTSSLAEPPSHVLL